MKVCRWKFSLYAITLLFTVALTISYSDIANAEAGDQYLLPKFGVMSIKLKNSDPLISFGVMYGFGMSDNVSFEAEYNSGFSGGDYENIDIATVVKGHYRVETFAGYLVYRYPFAPDYYIKTKVGFLNEQVEVTTDDSDVPPSNNKSDTGVAGGIGAGASLGEKLTLEFEVTIIDKDITFYSVGTHYRF